MAVTTATKPTQSRTLPEVGIGAVPTAVNTTVKADEFGGSGVTRQTRLTLNGCPITLTDTLAYASVKIYTFPVGRIVILGCVASLAFTTTSAIASTLNSGVTVQYGVGTAAASATTLATTMINIAPGTGQSVPTFTSSTTINVASSTVTTALVVSSTAQFDGTSTAIDVYLNVAVGTATDIDADATLTVAGTITITWMSVGDL